MCTHNQCFEQKYEKYYNFSSENFHFYNRELSQYIVWACYRNAFTDRQCLVTGTSYPRHKKGNN